jgi:hypothetical protein
MGEIHHQGPFCLASPRDWSIPPLAQFRTCLWLRAGRRKSGQEAGKSPFVDGMSWWRLSPSGISRTGSRRRKPAALPEAGDAAQSNDGAGFFSVVDPFQRIDALKRLVLLAGRAVGFPLQTMAVLSESASLRTNCRRRHSRQPQGWHRMLSMIVRASPQCAAVVHHPAGFTLERSIAGRLWGEVK